MVTTRASGTRLEVILLRGKTIMGGRRLQLGRTKDRILGLRRRDLLDSTQGERLPKDILREIPFLGITQADPADLDLLLPCVMILIALSLLLVYHGNRFINHRPARTTIHQTILGSLLRTPPCRHGQLRKVE